MAIEEPFEASSDWCKNLFIPQQLATRIQTHESEKVPEDSIPKLIDFMLYLRSYFAVHSAVQSSRVYAMDEKAVWFHAVSNWTMNVVGSRTVSLASAGLEEQNVTVALTAAADGTKRLPFIIFKGKGKTADDKLLMARRDIQVAFSDNGWFNTGLTVDWLKRVLGTIAFGKRLLIWDSYRCHRSQPVTKQRRQQNADCVTVPGGCTGLIQGPDVSWNKPFKGSLQEQYNEWLCTGQKTYGRLLPEMFVPFPRPSWVAWLSRLTNTSFKCCGQVRGVSADYISCFKDGRPAASGRQRRAEAFETPLNPQAPARVLSIH